MKLRYFLLLAPALVYAHVVSMSTGELKVDGARASYELRMPVYEANHAPQPERTLLEHLHFRGGGGDARVQDSRCAADGDTFVCTATLEFPKPPDGIEVDCTLAAVTVPNHIHVLRAYRGANSDQAIFDSSFTSAELRFRPPQPWETATKEAGAGIMRAATALPSLVFVLCLAIAGRKSEEAVKLMAALACGEAVACFLYPRLPFVLPPRFVEAAAALTIAYLAFEIVLLPESRSRWLVAGILGLFHGLYFSLFLATTSFHVPAFLIGVLLSQAGIFALLSIGKRRLPPKTVPALAGLLLATGVGWFALRVWV